MAAWLPICQSKKKDFRTWQVDFRRYNRSVRENDTTFYNSEGNGEFHVDTFDSIDDAISHVKDWAFEFYLYPIFIIRDNEHNKVATIKTIHKRSDCDGDLYVFIPGKKTFKITSCY